MDGTNIILTGIPRSGTTLTCHLLNKLPAVVALHEPMDVFGFARFESRDAICDEIDRFFLETRESIRMRGTVVSKHVDGQVPDNPVAERFRWFRFGLRSSRVTRGEMRIRRRLAPEFRVIVKHPSAFTALLDALVRRFPVYAVIRNPLAVLSSWNSVAMAVQRGHAPAAERLDRDLAGALDRMTDRIERQLYLLAWFFERYDKLLPGERVLRYEDIVASRGKVLSVIAWEAGELEEPLANKNANELYDREVMRTLGKRLLKASGAYWEFYSRESVERLIPG